MRTSNSRSRLRANPLLERPPTPDNVTSALATFYNSTSTEERDQAENWLIAFRRTNEAWGISVNLLPSQTMMVAHFAAHTLQEKIKTQWHVLPPQNQTEIFSILIHYFCEWSNGPNVLLTRICLAISQAAIHAIPHQWPNVTNDILQLLHSQSPKDMRKAVLMLFRVLPEELKDALITEQRRRAVETALKKDVDKIIPLLLEFLRPEQTNEELKHSALQCLMNWKIPVQTLLKTPLLEYVIECLKNIDSMIQDASDFLVKFLEDEEIRQYEAVRLALLKQFVALEDRFGQVVESGDTAAISAFVHMYSEIGDLLADLITKEPVYGPKLSLILARCASLQNHGIAAMAFRFWYELEGRLSSLEPSDSSCKERFVQPFCQMVHVLRRQCILPDRIGWSTEQHEEFTSMRSEAADTMMYCYQFLQSKCSVVLCQILEEDLKNQANPRQWALIEATLFCFKATFEVVEADDPLVSHVIKAFPRFPSHPKLAETALLVLGDMARWLSFHLEFVPTVLQYIVPSLKEKQLVEAASKALNYVSHSCRTALVPHLNSITAVVVPLLSDTQIAIEARCFLLESVAQVIYQLEFRVSGPMLMQLAAPIVQRISQYLTQGQTPEVLELLLQDLRLFGHVCMSVKSEDEQDDTSPVYKGGHPLFAPVQAIWPHLDKSLHIWSRLDDRIIMMVMRIVKLALSNLNSEYFTPFLPGLVPMISTYYEYSPHEDYIKSFSITLGIFKTSHVKKQDSVMEDRNKLFADTISKLGTCTLTFMQKSPNFRPLVSRAFFELLCQVVRMAPNAFFGNGSPTCPFFRPGIDFFLFALEVIPFIDGRLEHRAVISFLKVMITSGNPIPRKIVLGHMKRLIEIILLCVSDMRVSRLFIPNFGALLESLRDHFNNELREKLGELLIQGGFPTPSATPQSKQQLFNDLFERNGSAFSDKLHTFAVICRGLDFEFGMVSKPFFSLATKNDDDIVL